MQGSYCYLHAIPYLEKKEGHHFEMKGLLINVSVLIEKVSFTESSINAHLPLDRWVAYMWV